MRDSQSLSHTKWDCKYHIVFIPKRRKKVIYGNLRQSLGTIFHELASHKGCEILEGHLKSDHVHVFHQSMPSAMWLAISKVKVPF